MSDTADGQRLARAALTYLVEPGDNAVGAVLRTFGPQDLVAAIRAGRIPAGATVAGDQGNRLAAAVGRSMPNWRARLAEIPDERALRAAERAGIRLVCPGEPEWPTQLDVLGDARPYALWLRGSADLRHSCLRSVSVVGARAATAYGSHVSAELAAGLAGRGWAVVSGGAYGIDGSAHRGALAAEGITICVLACGVDNPYPQGNHDMFAGIAAGGLLVSEWPPGRNPTRTRFLARNRVIAALSRGTVVVEARRRSGALSTARHARDLCRPLMAVPGPVTSDCSAGCHWIMREWGAVCVTSPADVLEDVAGVGEQLAAPGPVIAAAELDPLTMRVLEAVPARGGAGPATIAVSAGVALDTTLSCLGLLAAGGFVARGP
ncbi:MAG TPA: DNA-processing protein DprA, partial [Streptosporangiaceae bacterium]|nr:DNA-processing protein DprA [Streptosporangiaceae bacterium]